MKITHINDYLETIQQMFPDVPKEDIKRILNYGWKLYYYLNSCGGDIYTKDENKFWTYTGYLSRNSITFFNIYKSKLIIRLRKMFRRKKLKWDGYYYFSLDKEQLDNYYKLIHRRGRPRKVFEFGDVLLFKLLDECKVYRSAGYAIFKVPMLIEGSFRIKKENFKSDKAELIMLKEPYKLKDILVTENKYIVLNE